MHIGGSNARAHGHLLQIRGGQKGAESEALKFHFCNFVTLAVRQIVDGARRVRDIVFARTGKDLILPRKPGQKRASLVQVDASGNQIALKPTCDLGPTVVSDDARGQLETVMPNRWTRLEGSSNGAAQVSVRRTDFQSMLRTFHNGFHEDSRRDELRDPLLA